MPKKVLINERLKAAVASGAPIEAAAQIVGAEEAGDGEVETLEVKGSEDETTEVQVATDDPTPEGEFVEPTVEVKAEPGMDSLMVKYTEAVSDLATVKAEKTSLEAEVSELKTAVTPLKAAVISSIEKMNVALGVSTMSMDSMSATAVAQQFTATTDIYNEKFKIGGVATIPNPEDKEASTASAPRVHFPTK